MKKTYKTFNGENRNCFFKVGKALVEARFTPTYTTDNEFVQKAIEESYSFKAGELQFVEQLQWLPIDRDENGFASIESVNAIVNLHKDGIPVALASKDSYGYTYDVISPIHDIFEWYGDIEHHAYYTHYLPIPKL